MTLDVIKISEFIYKIINNLETVNLINFDMLLYCVLIVIFIIILKFIYSNGISSEQQKSKFYYDALSAYIKVKNNIYLFKKNKIDLCELIVSLNSLIHFNNIKYLNLLTDTDIDNLNEENVHYFLNNIESIINTNILLIKESQTYSIDSNQNSFFNKVDSFIKTRNIKLLKDSVLISLLLTYILLIIFAFFINWINVQSTFARFILIVVFFLFIISIVLLIEISYSFITKDTSSYVIYLFIFNFLLALILVITTKLNILNSSDCQRGKLIILFSISIYFSLNSGKYIPKLHNIFLSFMSKIKGN
jgi:hypothetical protein